jgi:uncharacterized SAM-binding protein YcdF (DUF218 family)
VAASIARPRATGTHPALAYDRRGRRPASPRRAQRRKGGDLATYLLLPPADLLILALVGLVAGWWRRKLGALLVIAALVLLYGLSTPVGSLLLIRGLQRDPPLATVAGIGDAIVVLSAGPQYDADAPGALGVDARGLERLREAARLAKRTGLPVLVSGGPFWSGGPPIADQMRAVLEQDFGVPVAWVERQSRNTAENAIYSAALLHDAGIARIVLVTHAWHMPRARQSFAANGLQVVAAPVAPVRDVGGLRLGDFLPTAASLLTSSHALHEWIGIAWYRVRYGFAWPG